MTNCCRMNWSFFGSRHGRSRHDGAGTAIRRFFEERATPCGRIVRMYIGLPAGLLAILQPFDTTAIAMHDPVLGQNSADADGQAATVDVGDNVAFNAEAGNFKGV
ncbi:unnamed protein product [Sphagnum balticum]